MDPIIVAGMGPGGLAAALQAADKGLPVIMIEPRHDFIRGQYLKIDKQTVQFLNKYRDSMNSEDTKFFAKKINASENTVQIKDFQRFLARKAASHPNISVRKGDVEISDIDPETQKVMLKTDDKIEEIKFSHFVSGEGARRTIVNMVNLQLPDDKKIHFQDFVYQARQKASAAITMKLNEPIKENTLAGLNHEAQPFKLEHLNPLREHGWDQPYFPSVYVFRSPKNNKFFLSGEIPEFYRHIANDDPVKKQLLEQWGQFIMSVMYDVPKKAISLQQTYNETKNKLRATDFDLHIRYANTASVELEQGGAFVLVGDAYKNANFFFSHGLNDAVSDGIKFAECLSPPLEDDANPSFDTTLYEAYQQRQLKSLDTRSRWARGEPNLKGLAENFNTNMDELTKLSIHLADKELNTAMSTLLRSNSMGEREFDPAIYLMELEKVIKLAEQKVTEKIAASSASRLMLTLRLDRSSKNKSTLRTLEAINSNLAKSVEQYYKLNFEQRIKFHEKYKSASPLKS